MLSGVGEWYIIVPLFNEFYSPHDIPSFFPSETRSFRKNDIAMNTPRHYASAIYSMDSSLAHPL